MVQAHVLSKQQASGHGCDFQEYDRISGKMKACGCTPIAKLANNYVCIAHVVDVLAYSKSFDMYDVAPVGIKFGAKIDFKEDFLKLCKIENERRSSR